VQRESAIEAEMRHRCNQLRVGRAVSGEKIGAQLAYDKMLAGTREEREWKREEAERLADIQFHIEREARNKEIVRRNLEFEELCMQRRNPHAAAYNPRPGHF
jgi:hypothetical protein